MTKINAGIAMIKVFEAWGIDHIYGIPGGSFNSTMDALYHERQSVKYIQVRHEEAGALAAAADAKLTGKVGAVFGSAGPGATHLINGLYDAQMDNVPVVALLGQVASSSMNYNDFQEMNENPMFADVSIYNRTVMSPESLPHVVDEAIKAAYKFKGVAVVTIPVDYGFAEIDKQEIATAKIIRQVFSSLMKRIYRLPFLILNKQKNPSFISDKVSLVILMPSMLFLSISRCLSHLLS